MAWLIGPMIASFVASFFVAKVLEIILGSMTGIFVSVIKPAVFVTTWAGVSTQSVMRSFTRSARRLRQGNAAMMKTLARIK